MMEWTNQSRSLLRVEPETIGMTRLSKNLTLLSGGEMIIGITLSMCALSCLLQTVKILLALLLLSDSLTRAVSETLLFSLSGLSTRGGATTRRDPVYLLGFPHPLTELLLVYYLHHLSGDHLLSYPRLPRVPGLILEQAITPLLLQTPTSCHATPSEKCLVDTHTERKSLELFINTLRMLHTHTCKHRILSSLESVHINKEVSD